MLRLVDRGYPESNIVAVRASPARPPASVAHQRKVNDAGLHLAVLFEGDQNTPKRISADEIPCAINRIDDPAASVSRFFAGAFLAQNSVVREGFLQHFSDQFIALLIGDRNR